MIRPNGDIIRSISALEDNAFFKILVQWFRDSLKSQAIGNAYLTGELAVKGAGKVLQLDELLKYIDQNKENLKNIKREE